MWHTIITLRRTLFLIIILVLQGYSITHAKNSPSEALTTTISGSTTAECGQCAEGKSYCAKAFYDSPGQYCGKFYNNSSQIDKVCCCPYKIDSSQIQCYLKSNQCTCLVTISNNGHDDRYPPIQPKRLGTSLYNNQKTVRDVFWVVCGFCMVGLICAICCSLMFYCVCLLWLPPIFAYPIPNTVSTVYTTEEAYPIETELFKQSDVDESVEEKVDLSDIDNERHNP